MKSQSAHETICNILGLGGAPAIDLTLWKRSLADKWDNLAQKVHIAMVGKYTELTDSYLSVMKALQHACLAANRKLQIDWVEASNLEENMKMENEVAHKGWIQKTPAEVEHFWIAILDIHWSALLTALRWLLACC